MRVLVIAAAIVGALGALGGPALAQRVTFDPATVYNIPLGHSPATGPADAPVTIVEWSDYACGYCNKVQTTLEALDGLFPGQLRWVHRTLPLDDDNTLTAEAALAAAAQGQFRPMHDRLYAVQGKVDRTAVELIARELGLDMVRFRADLDTRAWHDVVVADTVDAHRLGLDGTPMFFVNGRPVHGNQPLKIFVDTVDEELARASAVAPGPDRYAQLVGSGHPAADAVGDVGHPRVELDPHTRYRVGLGLPGHQLGPDTAAITIVEWSDFQCPFCAKNVETLAVLRERYGDQLRIIYRDIPMQMHRDAELAAEAGVAAAMQGKFWAFHDQVFSHFGALSRADLERFGAAAGLDMPVFRAALDERRYHDVVAAEAADGAALGVTGTPTMFINGVPIVGAHKPEDVAKLLDVILSGAQNFVAHGLAPADIYPIVMSRAVGAERADPSTIPDPVALGHVELPADDRGRVLAAACRRRDRARAAELVGHTSGEVRQRAVAVCAGEGIDLGQTAPVGSGPVSPIGHSP